MLRTNCISNLFLRLQQRRLASEGECEVEDRSADRPVLSPDTDAVGGKDRPADGQSQAHPAAGGLAVGKLLEDALLFPGTDAGTAVGQLYYHVIPLDCGRKLQRPPQRGIFTAFSRRFIHTCSRSKGSKGTKGKSSGTPIVSGYSLSFSARRFSTTPTISSRDCHSFFTVLAPDSIDQELYQALDWLIERQERIETKLAKRHLWDGTLVLYDVSSSYY